MTSILSTPPAELAQKVGGGTNLPHVKSGRTLENWLRKRLISGCVWLSLPEDEPRWPTKLAEALSDLPSPRRIA